MKIVIAILLFILTFFTFAYLADMVIIDKHDAFDASLQSYVNSRISPTATLFYHNITFFGSHFFLIPAYLVLIAIYFIKNRKRAAMNILAIGLTSTAVMFLLKEIFKRPRPVNPLIHAVNGFSFPSGHSFASFTFYGVVIYLIWRGRWKRWIKIVLTIFLILLASSIAYSRAYLRVHYPSDIIAGFCLSIMWLILSFAVITRLRFRRHH